MTRKEIIVNAVLNPANQNKGIPTIFGDVEELAKNMYDKLEESKKQKIKFDDFIVFEGAKNYSGDVIKDFFVDGSFSDQWQKGMVKVKNWFPFKYPVYTSMESKWQELELGLLQV